MLRVLSVCCVTVAASLLPILALDVVPLQRPEDGWDRNVSFWYRAFANTFLTVSDGLLQMQAIAPAAELTLRKCVRVGLFVACTYTAFTLSLASLWIFPIPFMTVLTMPAWLLFFLVGTVMTVGVRNFRQNAALKAQALLYARRLNLEAGLVLLYSAYSVIFAALVGWAQIAFLFVLPAMKYLIKRVMKRTVAELEDLVPVAVITVDLFNALYQSKCMQSSSSVLATVGIIGIDVAQNILSLRDLFRYMREVEALATDDLLANGVVVATLDIASEPTQLGASELLEMTMSSCAHLRLSERHAVMVARMRSVQDEARGGTSTEAAVTSTQDRQNKVGRNDAAVSDTPDNKSHRATSASIPTQQCTRSVANKALDAHSTRAHGGWTRIFPSGATVHPANAVVRLLPHHTRGIKEKAVVLKRTLELLWRCELILLVEFVEAAIPTLYALYLVILHQLPNAQFYPGMATLDATQLRAAVARILVYGALELLSLVSVHLVLQRRFKLSPLHQLAFTLESECLLVQGTFVAWAVVILQFTLAHHGVDFTFEFDWLTSQAGS